MDKDTSEIEKLTERISKDPKSKLFVPLAEEYKKLGDIEMSIHVLTEGLKNNPGYITAKSFLGRLLFEKGDLAGAQKELEEVVKAIPDNLMAQRKLGDLYALQGKKQDALAHYKTALSLSSRDEETAALIADLEAGRDVAGKLAKLHSQPGTGQGAPGKPATGTAGAAVPGGTRKVSADTNRAEEEPEEILVVEPLDAEAPGPSAAEKPPPGGGFDFLAEAAPLSGAAEERQDNAFDLNEPDQDRFQAPAVEVPPAAEEIAASAPPAESMEPPKAAKQADDFTTDTLAELYLAQGFYEKAIDIYERMLADNPDNQGLKNKLQQVRAAAGRASPAAPSGETLQPVEEEIKMETGPLPAFEEPFQDLSPASTAAAGTAGDTGEFAPPAANGFEPVEYVPGGQGSRESRMTPEPPAGQMPADRRETIDRLEQWLKNIMKEK